MKKIILFVCISFFAAAASAQVSYGVKGGLSIASLGGEDADGYDSKLYVHAGGFLEAPLRNQFSIRPELLLSFQGASGTGDSRINLTYLNIPVMFKYKFSGTGFFAQAGPQLGFLLGAKMKTDDVSYKITDDLKKVDIALAFGAGYKLPSNLGFDVRYNLGLSKLDEQGNGKIYNRVWQLGVFYVLGGK